jgi:hypothetical protein
MSTDQTTVIIPFGKHKGSTVGELLVKDQPYVEWLLAQNWLATRFAELHAALVARGAGVDASPEHNALQARFLDVDFRAALLWLVIPEQLADAHKGAQSALDRDISHCEGRLSWLNHSGFSAYDAERLEAKEELARLQQQRTQRGEPVFRLYSEVQFEQEGIDVLIRWNYCEAREPLCVLADRYHRDYHEPRRTIRHRQQCVCVELKPTIGDDYPVMLRQMHRLEVRTAVFGNCTASGVTEAQIRAMFTANGYRLISVAEIEAENPF